MKVSFFVSLGAWLMVLASPAQAEGIRQNWKANGLLAKVLMGAAEKFPGLSVSEGLAELDLKASSCEASIHRPGLLEGTSSSEDNRLWCNLVDINGKKGSLDYSLKEAPFESWGTRSNEAHWEREGLPRTFQIYKSSFNLKLMHAMMEQYKKDPTGFSDMGITGPDGSFTGAIGIAFDDTYDYVECILYLNGDGSHFADRCVFSFPEENGR